MTARHLLPVGFAAGAVAVGGVAGFLLAFTAVLLAVDRLLDLAGSSAAGADQAFLRLARARRRGERRSRLRRRPLAGLAYLADDTGWAAIAARRRLGLQTISVDSIVGTTDPQKAAAFDREFRPPPWSRERWMQMYLSAQRGTPLPPVSVYRVDGRHYLRDGHHRVSVARAVGAEAIDAHVVELVPARNDDGLRVTGGRSSSSGGGTRTHNDSVNSRAFCQLNYPRPVY